MLIAADSCVLPRNFTGSFEDEHDYDDEHDLVADFGVSSVERFAALCLYGENFSVPSAFLSFAPSHTLRS